MQKRFVLRNEPGELQPFRNQMRDLLTQWSWPEKKTNEWLLVLDEALTNVMKHAYLGNPGEIIVEVLDSHQQTEVLIEDHGQTFDPTKLPSPDLPKETPGGLGVHFIRTLTDCFEHYPLPKGNRLRLIKYKVPERRSHP